MAKNNKKPYEKREDIVVDNIEEYDIKEDEMPELEEYEVIAVKQTFVVGRSKSGKIKSSECVASIGDIIKI